MLAIHLRRAGYIVTVTGYVDEATRLAEQTPFDLVITDFRLRGETCLELLRFLQKKFPNIPVIIYSGFIEDPALSKTAKDVGAKAMLSKFCAMDKIMQEIRFALG